MHLHLLRVFDDLAEVTGDRGRIRHEAVAVLEDGLLAKRLELPGALRVVLDLEKLVPHRLELNHGGKAIDDVRSGTVLLDPTIDDA